jgi:hypothetical protein
LLLFLLFLDALVVVINVVFFFFQLRLKLSDFFIEFASFIFGFGLQCNNVVFGLLSNLDNSLVFLVLDLSFFP